MKTEYYLSFKSNSLNCTFKEFKTINTIFLNQLQKEFSEYSLLHFLKTDKIINTQASNEFNKNMYEEVFDEEIAYKNTNKTDKELHDDSKSPFGFNLSYTKKGESANHEIIFMLFGGDDNLGGGKISFIAGSFLQDKTNITKLMKMIVNVWRPDFLKFSSNQINKEVSKISSQYQIGLINYFRKNIESYLPSNITCINILGEDSFFDVSEDYLESNAIDKTISTQRHLVETGLTSI